MFPSQDYLTRCFPFGNYNSCSNNDKERLFKYHLVFLIFDAIGMIGMYLMAFISFRRRKGKVLDLWQLTNIFHCLAVSSIVCRHLIQLRPDLFGAPNWIPAFLYSFAIWFSYIGSYIQPYLWLKLYYSRKKKNPPAYQGYFLLVITPIMTVIFIVFVVVSASWEMNTFYWWFLASQIVLFLSVPFSVWVETYCGVYVIKKLRKHAAYLPAGEAREDRELLIETLKRSVISGFVGWGLGFVCVTIMTASVHLWEENVTWFMATMGFQSAGFPSYIMYIFYQDHYRAAFSKVKQLKTKSQKGQTNTQANSVASIGFDSRSSASDTPKSTSQIGNQMSGDSI